MSGLGIALIDASHNDANTPRNFRRELDADLVEFDATSGQLPPEEGFDAVVVTGSRSSVYWDEPWIEPTKAWVAAAIDRGLPTLGVCWGHQLLADVLGGDVRDMGAFEIGYREIEHTGTSPLFEGVDERFLAFTTHRDEVATLPPGAEEIAANDYSNHGFQKGRVFGVQFHPEYDRRTAREVTLEKELSAERREAVLAGITEENEAAAQQAKLVFDNFVRFVEDVREGRVSESDQSASA